MRLPAAPPRISARPVRGSHWSTGRDAAYIASATSAPTATSARMTVLNGKSVAFMNPNAVPVLWTRVRSKKPGMTVTLSFSGICRRTTAFTAWSSTTMTRAIQRSRWRDGTGGRQRDACAERIADHLVLPLLLERGVDGIAHLHQAVPVGDEFRRQQMIDLRKVFEVNRRRTRPRHMTPQIVGRDWRD